jgi:BNR repeat-like domain
MGLGAQGAILVGPNVMVSRESGYPNVELMIAANPKDARNLIGSAIVSTPVRDKCVIYSSMDDGNTWVMVDLPQLPADGSGNAQVAFGPDGTAYFSMLGQIIGEGGSKQFVITLLRSKDGGLSWETMGTYGAGHGPDHDQVTLGADGTIYTTCLCRFSDAAWSIGLFVSRENGAQTVGPMKIATAPEKMGVQSLNPLVLSDGVLFVPYYVFEPKELEERTKPEFDVYAVTSRDGGATFSAPTKIGTQRLDPYAHAPSPYAFVVFAVDKRSTKFRDRIYMLAAEAVEGRYVLKLSYSKDRGASWSGAKMVAPVEAATPYDNQYQPQIAVNRDGVVGMSWFDTREAARGGSYREYFTASLDGGETFLPAAKVASEASRIGWADGDVLRPTIDSPRTNGKGEIQFSMITSSNSHPNGGDYMGLVADENGTFHPFWSDTRTGSFQAWTAVVRVSAVSEAGAGAKQTDASSPAAPLGKRLAAVFDPSQFDAQTGIAEIPVRFKNVSESAICGRLRIRVRGSKEKGAPQILNASNGKAWEGAELDYSHSLGDFTCLEPGAVTDSIIWRVKLADAGQTFISFTVEAVPQ